jgi:hypothetical protein
MRPSLKQVFGPAPIDVTRASPARSFVEVFPRASWRTGHPADRARRFRRLAHRQPVARQAGVLIAVTVLATSGCGGDERATDATDFARDYLRLAAEGNIKRLCALRTDRALQRWGGQAACENRAKGLAIDPLPPRVSPGLRRGHEKKALTVNPHAANVVPDDTSSTGDRARVVIDFGKATLEDGHAIGGQILEMDLTSQGDNYKVARLGFAVFAD